MKEPPGHRPYGESPRVKVVTGRASFADDLALTGLLHARVLRSPHPHARIRSISAAPALALPGVVTVLTHEDVPHRIHARGGPGGREDALILGPHLKFQGDRVAVVAAEDPEGAERGCRAITSAPQQITTSCT